MADLTRSGKSDRLLGFEDTMSGVARNAWLTMVRPDMDGLPVHPVPPGFGLRWYRPGDEETWYAVQSAAERYVAVVGGISPERHLLGG